MGEMSSDLPSLLAMNELKSHKLILEASSNCFPLKTAAEPIYSFCVHSLLDVLILRRESSRLDWLLDDFDLLSHHSLGLLFILDYVLFLNND